MLIIKKLQRLESRLEYKKDIDKNKDDFILASMYYNYQEGFIYTHKD